MISTKIPKSSTSDENAVPWVWLDGEVTVVT
ncbi:hypothetical protein RAM_19460 [Amycolatopsis mediterranei S699]|uniref:Uncharacterized protein n=1 Tax=Amycolatopsis mediterranei (strain S699) TaxID=713604 RepID=A0A9R0NXD3_AMYMS|nr:hypothetical protein RAM_19460 [Amycolatopsis mediterranei S699]